LLSTHQQNEQRERFALVFFFFRSTVLPALIVLLFALALFAVSARIWLPGDMLAPAPVG
jgi:nitrogen fixation/metabolism regulation signal transduction histidine kinase